MDPLTLAFLITGGLLALGVGFATGRLVRVGAAQHRLETAVSEAEALARRTEDEAEAFQREHVGKARDELRRRQQRLEKKSEEFKEKQQRVRAKLDERKTRLELRARTLADREAALQQVADALDLLTAEASRRQTETEQLRAQVQTLATSVGRRQQELASREQDAGALTARLEEEQSRLTRLVEEHLQKLEYAGDLSREDAKEHLMAEMAREAKLEAAALVKDVRDDARRRAQREAQKVILKAIQRTAAQTTIENTVSVVELKSDDMKGRVIGREGRNIRAFEAATGIEVIVDDTPETVLVSGFDPVRREVARLSMEKLLADGRIHPARIEEVVDKTREEIDEEILEAGEQAALELQLHGLHPELVRLVGRMKYRSSFGQNLLAHSIEVAKLASIMAAELGLDARKARRGGLLHDIGKVAEEGLESPHAIVGMELCRRYKEHPDVCNAVGAHHDEVAMATPIAPIVQAADAVSGARPGARREALERYVERLQNLEALAASFEGVERVYAIQAGREIRVIVDPASVSDALAETLAADIARRIEKEMEYPGQIKVHVIREVRSVAHAH
ncbi:MAG: ribonuclease Y [Rhodothermaceae bacterium]|nr:ribonuclease Y [Rhodothermaceae bacterium]